MIYILVHYYWHLSFHWLHTFYFLFVAIAIRDKLESLCRELQRQNKMLMVYFYAVVSGLTGCISEIFFFSQVVFLALWNVYFASVDFPYNFGMESCKVIRNNPSGYSLLSRSIDVCSLLYRMSASGSQQRGRTWD